MPSLLFITPAWKRVELTRLCLWQRRLACDSLAKHGVDATCVVIADDENLDAAQEFGFETIASPNDFLSRRFNDGYQYAGENGFDYVCPIGSDSWIDPRLLERLPDRVMQVSRNYAIVREDGRRIAQLKLRGDYGFGCFTMPTRMLRKFRYRPCAENLEKGCDGSLYKALYRDRPPTVTIRELSALDIVAFRSEIQITPYERLLKRHSGVELRNTWGILRRRFPTELVVAASRLHAQRMVSV